MPNRALHIPVTFFPERQNQKIFFQIFFFLLPLSLEFSRPIRPQCQGPYSVGYTAWIDLWKQCLPQYVYAVDAWACACAAAAAAAAADDEAGWVPRIILCQGCLWLGCRRGPSKAAQPRATRGIALLGIGRCATSRGTVLSLPLSLLLSLCMWYLLVYRRHRRQSVQLLPPVDRRYGTRSISTDARSTMRVADDQLVSHQMTLTQMPFCVGIGSEKQCPTAMDRLTGAKGSAHARTKRKQSIIAHKLHEL
ncbi:hypothetical protein F5Y07DRAFT_177710 [Xylaria sp. FL0933]|nr:hypothetical protein F5Y07DRAFT_177710 [Xylaria sp. FL0933]